MRTASKVGVLIGGLLVVAVALAVKLSVPRPTGEPPRPNEDPKVETPPAAPKLAMAPRPQAVDASVPLPSPPPPKKPAAVKPKMLTEAELLDRLRKAQDTDEYLLSYDLAREGLRRFPQSPDAPEMAAMVVKSLARQGKVSEARAEAEEMVNKYAGTKWAREVERHTGAHPHVNQVPPD